MLSVPRSLVWKRLVSSRNSDLELGDFGLSFCVEIGP